MNIKNRKIYKIAIITIFLIGLVFLVNEVFAADLAISINGNTATVSSQYTGRVNLTATGATLSKSEVWLENSSDSVTVTVTDKTKGATITATPNNNGKKEMSDSDGKLVSVNAKSATIQGVKEEQPAQQTQQQPAVTYTNTNQTLYIKNNGTNVRKEAVSGAVITSLNAGTSVQVTGTGSNGWSRVSINGKTGYIRSDLLTSTKPAEEQKPEEKQEEKKKEKSTNKALKDLVVENYKLTPEFTPETNKYSLEVKGDVDKLSITPILQDEKAKFVVEGNENLKVGNNIVKITVTAEDGTTRIYTIAVTKSKDGEAPVEMLKLKDLKAGEATLQPSFNPETTSYVIELEDPASFKVDSIVATAADADVEVSVSESETADSSNGRIITVMLEEKNGTKTGVYQITIKKATQNPLGIIKNNKDNKIYIILGSIIAVLVVLIIVIIVLLKKTSNKEDDDEVYSENQDELSDNYDYSSKNTINEANNIEETNEQESENQYDEIVENSNVKSQILSSAQKQYNTEIDDDMDETQVYEDFEDKLKKKGKHF
ncbi:MAG: cadherin-like beta sandwich domain-containing protein [Clostridia bacterium]|nr:cadherin-like beta sandwich domain-containing protein [Clostridia bacterium]